MSGIRTSRECAKLLGALIGGLRDQVKSQDILVKAIVEVAGTKAAAVELDTRPARGDMTQEECEVIIDAFVKVLQEVAAPGEAQLALQWWAKHGEKAFAALPETVH